MRYDKATVKEFILNYHKIQENSVSCDEDVGIDDFFNVNDQAETHEIDNSNVEDVILYNELEEIVEQVGTDKEHYIFWLLSEGYSYKEIGNVFYVTDVRVKQIFDGLLSKLS